MRLYSGDHQYYCGIDLHTRAMYVCILDADGNKLLHRNLRATPEAFLKAVEPYRDDLVVAVECTFTWYWAPDSSRLTWFTAGFRPFISGPDGTTPLPAPSATEGFRPMSWIGDRIAGTVRAGDGAVVDGWAHDRSSLAGRDSLRAWTINSDSCCSSPSAWTRRGFPTW